MTTYCISIFLVQTLVCKLLLRWMCCRFFWGNWIHLGRKPKLARRSFLPLAGRFWPQTAEATHHSGVKLTSWSLKRSKRNCILVRSCCFHLLQTSGVLSFFVLFFLSFLGGFIFFLSFFCVFFLSFLRFFLSFLRWYLQPFW